jgi:sugar O-acyltransferase (sialic acid O-acetyltransferase NeuD family)
MILGIVGAGSHGRCVAEIAMAMGWQPQFFDDRDDRGLPLSELEHARGWVLGVHWPKDRAALALRCPTDHAARLVHPSAVLGTDVHRARGTVIAAGVVITGDVRLGDHVHVNVGATISQGSSLSDYCTVSPGAHVCGEVTVGARTTIGAGAVIKNLVRIGRDVTIGAGAVVIDDVEDNQTVVGVPARPLVRA